MLPKIEVLDICDSDDLMEWEEYWIHQLQAWGFNLLNKYKKAGVRVRPSIYIKKQGCEKKVKKQIYRKKSAEQWEAERKERAIAKQQKRIEYLANKEANKKWTDSSFEIGMTFNVQTSKKRSFNEIFRLNARKLNKAVSLSFHENGDRLIATVIEKRISNDLYEKVVTRTGKTRYYRKDRPRFTPLPKRAKSPKFKYGFENIKEGDVLHIDKEKFESFKMCLKTWCLRHVVLKFKYEADYELDKIKCTCMPDSWDGVNKKLLGFSSRIRKNRQLKISKSAYPEILKKYVSGVKCSVLAREYNVSDSLMSIIIKKVTHGK
jgi:hypothetical protein